MIKSMILSMMLLPVFVSAGVLESVGDFLKTQQIETGMAFSPLDVNDMRTEAVVYLKGISFGEKGLNPLQAKKGAKPYIDIDIGGSFRKSTRRVLLIVNLHPQNIAVKLLNRLPFSDRLKIPVLPEALTIGPAFRLPLPGENLPWTWDNGFKIVVALKLG